MPDFCNLGLEFEIIIVIFEVQRRRICLFVKFGAKIKILKFGTNKASF